MVIAHLSRRAEHAERIRCMYVIIWNRAHLSAPKSDESRKESNVVIRFSAGNAYVPLRARIFKKQWNIGNSIAWSILSVPIGVQVVKKLHFLRRRQKSNHLKVSSNVSEIKEFEDPQHIRSVMHLYLWNIRTYFYLVFYSKNWGWYFNHFNNIYTNSDSLISGMITNFIKRHILEKTPVGLSWSLYCVHVLPEDTFWTRN